MVGAHVFNALDAVSSTRLCRLVFVNAACLADRLFAAVERAGPSCFRGCSGTKDRTDP